MLSGSIPLKVYPQSPDIRKCTCGTIPLHHFKIEGESFICVFFDKDEPSFFKEAITSPASEKWMVFMRDEMSSMVENNV